MIIIIITIFDELLMKLRFMGLEYVFCDNGAANLLTNYENWMRKFFLHTCCPLMVIETFSLLENTSKSTYLLSVAVSNPIPVERKVEKEIKVWNKAKQNNSYLLMAEWTE